MSPSLKPQLTNNPIQHKQLIFNEEILFLYPNPHWLNMYYILL